MRKLIAEALNAMPDASPAQVAEYLIANHGPSVKLWIFAKLTTAIKQAVQRQMRIKLKANPAQAWLPLPDLKNFQHIPVIVREDSFEEFRKRIAAKERQLQSYRRLSVQKEKIVKRELREMKRLEPLIAPYFVDKPSMTVEGAIELYRQSVSTEVATQKKAVKSRKRLKRQ